MPSALHSGERDDMRRGLAMKLARPVAGLAAATLFAAAGTADAPSAPADRGEWIDVPPQSLVVDAGSPLDFSALVAPGPAGSHGSLRETPDRMLAFDGAPGTPARFNCGMLGSGAYMQPTFPSHAESDRLAEQLVRHGYSLVRLHNIDSRLTRDAPAGQWVDAEQLDRFRYLLAALKRRGIYWIVDVLSQGKATLGRTVGPDGAASPDDVRVRMQFDPVARETWLKFLDTVFAKTNPYTGLSTLADPALAFVVGANENGIAFAQKPGRSYPAGLAEQFDTWVKARFRTTEAIAGVLPDATPRERAGTDPIALPPDWSATGPRMRLLMRFISDLELDTYAWMRARLAERGFQGPLLASNEWAMQMTNRTRSRLPVTDVHAYAGEVTSFTKGTRLRLPSSTSTPGIAAWLLNASARWIDRPLVASEYGTAFPNPYRYESGLLFPALASFQGYTAICRTAFQPVEAAVPRPVDTRFASLRGYMVGLDPTERAAETLSAMLFFRGDVGPATSTIAVPMGEPDIDRPGSVILPLDVRRGALLARFGLYDPAGNEPPPGARTRIVLPSPRPETLPAKVVTRLTEMITGSADARLAKLVNDMRAGGELPAGNRTDPALGLYESQTGEILLDERNGRIQVVTPRTEAVSTIGAARNIRLGLVRVGTVDGGALLAATSLDRAPLADSRRILLILAGDSRNSGMLLDGSGTDRTLVDWGHAPIQMRRVRANLELRNGWARTARLTTLSLRGTPIATRVIPVGQERLLRLQLDIGAVRGAPTNYFLLELQ